MKIAIGCDHGGIVLKDSIIKLLHDRDIKVTDVGCFADESVDYPIYGEKVANLVASCACDKGIVLCGTGIGIGIAANKVKGIRCGIVHNEFTAKMTAEHNNANMIALGGRIVTPDEAVNIVKAWLDAPAFEGERHINRVNMITDIESKL